MVRHGDGAPYASWMVPDITPGAMSGQCLVSSHAVPGEAHRSSHNLLILLGFLVSPHGFEPWTY